MNGESEASKGSIVSASDLAGMSKPATELIRQASAALGAICHPWQIARIARAEKKASRLRKESEIECTDIQRRAEQRWLAEEARAQANIEAITSGAVDALPPGKDVQEIEQDWLVDFFQKCRHISDKDMQAIWSRILAGEAVEPNTYSRRMTAILQQMGKEDAELFRQFVQFSVVAYGSVWPIITDVTDLIYGDKYAIFEQISRAVALGLADKDFTRGFVKGVGDDESLTVECGAKKILLSALTETVPVGKVMLTPEGDALARLCEVCPPDGFAAHVRDYWQRRSIPCEYTETDEHTGGAGSA